MHNPEGKPYTPTDLRIGAEVVMYGRTYKIVIVMELQGST